MALLTQLLILIVAGASVAVADALIKRAIDARGSELARFVAAIAALYGVQMACFVYVFMRRMRLGIAGNLQMVAYSFATVALGLLLFRERLSIAQLLGVVFAAAGCVLLLREPA